MEDLAQETLADSVATVADQLDFLVSEIRTGIGESLYALSGARDLPVSFGRLVVANPYIAAGFYMREADGVTFWHGERGDYPDPWTILDENIGVDELKDGSETVQAVVPAMPNVSIPPSPYAAPSDQLSGEVLVREEALSPSVQEDYASAPAEENVEDVPTPARSKAAFKQQIASVRELNVSNRMQILESDSAAKDISSMQQSRERKKEATAEFEDGANSDLDSLVESEPAMTQIDRLFAGESGQVGDGVELVDPFAYEAAESGGSIDAVSRSPVSGWSSTVVEHVGLSDLAWIRFPDEEVVLGAWLDSRAIEAELAKAVYLNARDGIQLTLEGPEGQVYRGGSSAGNKAVAKGDRVSMPVGPTLAGWKLSAVDRDGNPFGQSFRILGAIVVAGLGLAIVLAGGLILYQSRKDALDAQRKTTFVANVSHELKTPLTSIRMFAEMLAEGRVEDPQKRNKYLERMSAETQRLGRLVNNVLDFSRLDRKRREFQQTRCDVGVEVEELLEMQRGRLRAEGIEVEYDAPAEPCFAELDRDALEQILLNLLDNAVKYAADGGRVTIEVEDARSGVELRVRDFGPGISGRERKRVFRAFHRVDDRLTSEQSGCGLGLSISMRLAEGMGAELRLEENRPRGCCFVLRWPDSGKEVSV